MNPEDINKNIDSFNKNLATFNKQSGNNISGVSNIPISADMLTTSQKPMNLAQPRPQTESAGLRGAIESSVNETDQFTQNLQKEKQTTEKTRTQALSDLVKNMLGTKGETSLTAESYAKTVDPVEKELGDINQKIREEQLAVRRQIERVQDNKAGLFGGAVQDEVNRLERESLRKQADLTVIQQGIQGRFDSAKAIADRAVQAQLEQQKIENEALKLNYEENKEAFTTAEKRLFETQYADRERKLNQEEKRLQEISDLSIQALQDGAPTAIVSAMRVAKTPEEAIRIGGQYVGSLDRRIKEAQLAKIYSDLQSTPKKTEAQAKAVGFAQRMIESQAIIDQIGSQFISPENYVTQSLPNILKTEDRQKFEQAQRNFINAVLRRESGAVISEEEFDNARKQYFPQPGDTRGVLEQKRQNRVTSTNSLLNESGVEQIPYIPENEQTKTVNGQTYVKVQGGWKLQK